MSISTDMLHCSVLVRVDRICSRCTVQYSICARCARALSSAGASAPSAAAQHSSSSSSTSTATESESDMPRRSAEGGVNGVPPLRRVSSEKGRLVPAGSGQTPAAGASQAAVYNGNTPASPAAYAAAAAASAVSTPTPSSGYSSQKTSARSSESSPPQSAAPPNAAFRAVVSTANVSPFARPQSSSALSAAPAASNGQHIVSSDVPTFSPSAQSRPQSLITHVYANNSNSRPAAAPQQSISTQLPFSAGNNVSVSPAPLQNGLSRVSASPAPQNPSGAIPIRRAGALGAVGDLPAALENSCEDTSSTLTTGSPPRSHSALARPLPTPSNPSTSAIASNTASSQPQVQPPSSTAAAPNSAAAARMSQAAQLNNLSASPKSAARKSSQPGPPDRMQPILPNKLAPVRADLLSEFCVSGVLTLCVPRFWFVRPLVTYDCYK